MSDDSHPPLRTVAIYDRPPWWRQRRVLRIALPVVAALAAVAAFAFIF
jgi:hypothetical protein